MNIWVTNDHGYVLLSLSQSDSLHIQELSPSSQRVQYDGVSSGTYEFAPLFYVSCLVNNTEWNGIIKIDYKSSIYKDYFESKFGCI